MYEPLWLHPSTAERRGIKDGDIVKVFNERSIVLAGARVWGRVVPGVAYIDHGTRYDWIIPGELDRDGAINLICPTGIVSKIVEGKLPVATWLRLER